MSDQSTRDPHIAARRDGAATIRSVTTRVAGEVSTEAFAHHFGTSSQQVGVTVADTLTYVDTAAAATRIAGAFEQARAVARVHRLTTQSSRTWLAAAPGTRPPGLLLRFSAPPTTHVGFQPRRDINGRVVPAHIWVRVGPVLWQLCDTTGLERVAEVWGHCARILGGHTSSAPAGPESPSAAGPAAGLDDAVEEHSGVGAPTDVDGPFPLDDPRPDAELLAAYARDDDQAAFAVLYRRHRARVLAVATRVIGQHDGAEDAAQLAWIKVAVGAAGFRGDAKVTTWLHRIAHTTAISLIRQRSARTVAEAHYRRVQHTETVTHGPVRVDEMLLLDDLLQALTPAHREAVRLVDLEGLDLGEAAARLQVPEGTLKSRRARARKAMAGEAARRGIDLERVL